MSEKRKHRILYNPTFGGFIFTVMIIAYVFISFVGSLIMQIVGLTDGVLYYVINAMFSILAMFTVTKVVEIQRQEKRHFLHHFEKCNPKYVLFAIIFAGGMFLGLGFANSLIASIFETEHSSGNALPLDSITNYVIFTIFYAIIPAIEEEVFFRGLLYENLEHSNKTLTVLFLAFAFSVYHSSIHQTVYQFVYGLGLTVLVIKSGSIIPSMIAHFINNFAVLTLEYFKIPLNLFNPVVIVIGCILLVCFVLLIVFDKYHVEPHPLEDGQKPKENIYEFFIPFGLFGTAICVLMIILGAVM
ncbi:MAG: CPBP family intramembrane metalloprotease [Clostridia bacterium]|nr:CPBP family intramembrane metalloprotease [Clostridia bacterium]